MQPRPHQLECLQHVVRENTIINMPTGTGKTLVGVLAIDHFRGRGKVMFLVPTRPLVTQQANYVREHCARPTAVAELQGAQTDHLTAQEWQDLVQNDVLVGTPEVFRRALVDTKFLTLRPFALLIFDECHNATGNSPMASIMRDAVHRYSQPLRILGLTASFVHGSLKDVEKKRRNLEGLLQCRLFCPDVEERPMDFQRVSYMLTVQPEMERVVQNKIEALLQVAERAGVPLNGCGDVVRRGVHVFSELGLSAFIYFLSDCVAPQIQTKIDNLNEVRGCRAAPAHIPQLRQQMRDAAARLSQDGSLTSFPFVTDKAKTLLGLIEQMSPHTRVIIFSEQTVLAHPIAHLLQQHTGRNAGVCTGVGSMTDGQRKTALEEFRSGRAPLLTCTAALEEGLDVKQCEVVVRFSKFQTTKSHVQGSGRARAWNARVFYFDNDPALELNRAALMEKTAKETALSLSTSDLLERRKHRDVLGVHPFHTSCGAEISVFNCVQIVYEYAAKAMGTSFRPEESMLRYTSEVVCEFPLQRRKTLVGVTIPSPSGFFEVEVERVHSWWGQYDLDDVAEASRMRNWDQTDRCLRRFMYVVAVELSKRGLLDQNNQPSVQVLCETRLQCPVWTMRPGSQIGVRYDPQGLTGDWNSRDTVFSSPTDRGEHVRRRIDRPELVPLGAVSGPPNLTTGVADKILDNFKGKLNQVTKDRSSYATVHSGSGFICTVTLPTGRSVTGTAARTKKGAEQDAAEAALRTLGET
uniref:RNA helicase n=1 Tax=Noctiluca scintillans TaxID=2966 RepID=A0A7S1AC91_NOCSC|mmetsp:Transcript_40407/g.107145  ORF Transcript_40407/g.107145 Transcript_40407/m.107145 type:complete len:749 (+) Transcript_40407:61-2307(+)